MSQKIALVTGGNRGIGLEICQQLAKAGCHVFLGSRSLENGQKAREQNPDTANNIEALALDVNSQSSVEEAITKIEQRFGRLDILVNNAGVMLDVSNSSVFELKPETLQDTLNTNLFGPLRLTQAAIALMKKHDYGRIVNLSSGLGQLSEMGGGYAAYRISKTSLNALTRIVHAELNHSKIKINAMCPGWVKTDMGGPNAQRSVDQGADTAFWLATLPETGPSGLFFRDRQAIDW